MQSMVLWDWRVVLDLYLGGIGIGAFLFGVLLYYLNAERYKKVVQTALVIAPVLVIVGLIFLMAKLGQPMRAVTAIFSVNLSSVMGVGILLQSVLVPVMLIAAWRALTCYDGEACGGLNKILFIAGGVLSLLTGAYHGALLAGMGLPVWNGAVIMMFLLSSLATGVAVAWALALLKSGGDVVTSSSNSYTFNVAGVMMILVVLTAVSIYAWMLGLGTSGLAAGEALAYLRANYAFAFYALAWGLGIVVPVVLLVMALMKKDRELSAQPSLLLAASVLVGGFALKYIVVYLAQVPYL